MASVECIQEAVRMLVAERQSLRERDASRNELESNRLELADRRQQFSRALIYHGKEGVCGSSPQEGFLSSRGVGPSRWVCPERVRVHSIIRRRAAILHVLPA